MRSVLKILQNAEMKTCLICQVPQQLSNFAPNPKGRGGLHPWCRECVREYSRARYTNKIAPTRPPRHSGAEVRYTPLPKNWEAERATRPGYKRAETVFRKLRKTGAAPKWMTVEDTQAFYEAAAKFGLVVDHITPLKHRLVCGLHVPWNMQLLTPAENSRKHNKFTP